MKRRLYSFYATTKEYNAFKFPSNQKKWFEAIHHWLPRFDHGRKLRILEVGAGRSTFGLFVRQFGQPVEYHAQDVTGQNRDWLLEHAQRVWIGDVDSITAGSYDMVFSTFVFEHIALPTNFLEAVDRLPAPGGVHILICPRYDLPGYLCPSLRHLRGMDRLKMQLFMVVTRVIAHIDREPRFWVNTDLALFHLPWFRDSDACHLVNRFDVVWWYRRRGYSVHNLDVVSHDWREFFYYRLMVLKLVCIKPNKGT
jgi:SAM-dependent methyltransferase